MAIDATISIRGTDDEYDLDIVAALALEPDAAPDEVLDLLYCSVVGYPTSQEVERQTRCVTVRYADRMHLDITAGRAVAAWGRSARAISSTPIPTIRRGCISMRR